MGVGLKWRKLFLLIHALNSSSSPCPTEVGRRANNNYHSAYPGLGTPSTLKILVSENGFDLSGYTLIPSVVLAWRCWCKINPSLGENFLKVRFIFIHSFLSLHFCEFWQMCTIMNHHHNYYIGQLLCPWAPLFLFIVSPFPTPKPLVATDLFFCSSSVSFRMAHKWLQSPQVWFLPCSIMHLKLSRVVESTCSSSLFSTE